MVLYVFSLSVYILSRMVYSQASHIIPASLFSRPTLHMLDLSLSLALKRSLTVSALLLRPHSLNSFLK